MFNFDPGEPNHKVWFHKYDGINKSEDLDNLKEQKLMRFYNNTYKQYEDEMTTELNVIIIMEEAMAKNEKPRSKDEPMKIETLLLLIEFSLELNNFHLLT